AKRSVGAGTSNDLPLDTIGTSEMVEATGKGYGRKYRPGHEITVLDNYGEIATVKVASVPYIDYLHLARFGDRWLIVNVLWQRRGRWAEGRDWLERFLTAISAPTPTLRCRAVSTISGLAFRLGENEKARQFGNEALEIARRLGDKPLIVGSLTRLARVGLRDNNPRQTMILCREALALAEEAGDEELSLSPLHCLAEATRMDGDYEGARQLYRRSLDLNRKRGDELVIG